MIFALSNIKVCWTDKMTLLFRPPFPGQTDNNRVYHMYLERVASEEDQSLLQWLRSHRTSGVKAKPYNEDKVLVGVKFVSVFNPVYFYQYLTMHHAHRRPYQLRHPEEATMPSAIQYFSQAAALQPHHWSTSAAVTERFSRDGHKDYFVNTLVSYVTSLYNSLQLWTRRVIDGSVGDISSVSIEHLYPLSPLQHAIMTDVTAALTARHHPEEDHQHSSTDTWQKYRVLLGKPGTGKSQVLIRVIDYTLSNEFRVLVSAPVALLAQSYGAIFGGDIDVDTLHGAFHIPVQGPASEDVNYALNKYDLVVVDEASMISSPTFNIVAATFNRLNLRPVVVFAGDKCQQEPLETIDARTTVTTSIINDSTIFTSTNSIHHMLYQQFRITDPQYAAFLDFIRYTQPTQQQVDRMQEGIILCEPGPITDNQLWTAFHLHPQSSVMTVSRCAAQRVNSIVVNRLFPSSRPLSDTPCTWVAESDPIFPHRHMRVIFTENRRRFDTFTV